MCRRDLVVGKLHEIWPSEGHLSQPNFLNGLVGIPQPNLRKLVVEADLGRIKEAREFRRSLRRSRGKIAGGKTDENECGINLRGESYEWRDVSMGEGWYESVLVAMERFRVLRIDFRWNQFPFSTATDF